MISPVHGYRRLTWDVWQGYRLADGTRTIQEIAGFLARNWQIDDLAEVPSFYSEAELAGYVQLAGEPAPRPVPLIGSEELWLPERCMIELTDRCNLRCQYCCSGCTPQNNSMLPAERIPWLFSLLRRKGVHSVQLSGGEPAIHPGFAGILACAVDTFESVGVMTNGVHVSTEALELMAAHRDKVIVQVSIDGSTEEVSTAVRGTRGTCALTLQTIQALLRAGVPTRAAVVVTPDNQADLASMCELLRRIGVPHAVIMMPDGVGRGTELIRGEYRRNSPRWAEAVECVAQAYEDYPDILFDPASPLVREQMERVEGCDAGRTNFVIDPRGNVKPCPLLPASAGAFGNIFTDDYDALFNSGPASRSCQAFAIRTGQQECEACKYGVYCGKCLSRVFLANRERVEDGQGLCPVARRAGLSEGFDFSADIQFAIDLTPFPSAEHDGRTRPTPVACCLKAVL